MELFYYLEKIVLFKKKLLPKEKHQSIKMFNNKMCTNLLSKLFNAIIRNAKEEF